MKLISPPEKWESGDIFIEKSISGIDVCQVVRVRENDSVAYRVLSKSKRAFDFSLFTFDSVSFKNNKIFRIKDNKKMAFDLIFKISNSR